MSEQLALLPEYLTAHLQLTLIALLLSAAVALPLGIAATRVRRLEPPALAVAGVIQTVPGLALLALMVPVLAAVDLQSIGFLPAICGLTLYGVFPILRNTVTGISGVSPVYKEAARGVGMTPLQQLARVELPLAMPVLVAGLRTATVWLVGMATLSTPVGATSLGNYIFSGLQIRNYVAVIVGCVAAGGLALLLDRLVRAVEDGLARRRRRQVAAALGLAVLLYGYAGVTLVAARFDAGERPVAIGSKPFTEQYVLSAAIARLVERETGRPTSLVQSLGSTVAFDALAAGEIDLLVDYSGTIWVNQMQGGDSFPGRAVLNDRVRRFLRERHGITLAAMLGFENTYAVAARREDADRLGLRTISDLAAAAPRFVFGSDYEFFARPEWPSVRDTYGLSFRELRSMDVSLMYQAVATGEVDVITAYGTDGRIDAFDLRVLEDDRGAIPPYDAVVLAGARIARLAPDVVAAVARLEGAISAERMRTMNFAVDEAGEHPSRVGERFVRTLP